MTGAAFDVLAARYEALWSATSIGRSQREQVWRWIDPLFRSGQRVLDLGCGIGDDAVHLMDRGVEIEGIDASIGMVREAQARGVNARRLAIEELSAVSGRFDGAISNFGALNCVERLEPVAEDLARLIVSGGALAVCVIGRTCAWEIAHYFPRKKAFRRWARRAGWQPAADWQSAWPPAEKSRQKLAQSSDSPSPIGRRVANPPQAASLPYVYYPTVRQIARAFAPRFRLVRWTGIGLFVPPSYITGRSKETISRFSALDRGVARLPIARAMADHRLLIFRRV
ncbi:MAG TPA: methyltransferase domain-containing protein [Verrucomicrobiae bacterium]|nr:methyltransferase domain-containing protein [Verrucomicrobiae bacterium]